MKKSIFLLITLFAYATASSGCWSSKASGGVVLNFELDGKKVDITVTPRPEPKILNEKMYGGFYTETGSYHMGTDEHISFGYYREDESEESQSGIWHIKGDSISRLFSGGAGMLYQKGKNAFAYVNSEYWHEKQSVIFEIRRTESGEILLHEIFFLLGKVWKIIPVTENKIWVVGHSNSLGSPMIAEVELGPNTVTTRYGSFVKSTPSLDEIYGAE